MWLMMMLHMGDHGRRWCRGQYKFIDSANTIVNGKSEVDFLAGLLVGLMHHCGSASGRGSVCGCITI